MKVKVILNPYANRWGAQALVPAVRAAFARADVSCDLVLTTAPAEGVERARLAALNGYDAVVAAGGDGTVSEVVNGLIRAAGENATVPLGVLPLGTGNDFSDMTGTPRQLDQAVSVIAGGQTRQVDAGRVNDHYFDNNCALAMEPMVTIENIRMKRMSGNVRYLVALLKSMLKLKAWQMRIVWDDGQYEGPLYLLSVCNSPRTGGLFYMSPRSRVDDGLLDFVFAPEMPRHQVLSLLPRLLRGSHVNHSMVTYCSTRRLVVESSPGTPIHADGEVIAEAAERVEYEVLPGKITLLTAG